jgi:hypothetical protein
LYFERMWFRIEARLTDFLKNPTADGVEVVVGFVTEYGSLLHDLSPRGLHGEYSL